MTPGQRAVQEFVVPHLQKARDEAHRLGVPFLCAVQTPGLIEGMTDLGAISAHITGFASAAPRRFLIDYFLEAKAEPSDADFSAEQRPIVEAFLSAIVMWMKGGDAVKQNAVIVVMVLQQLFPMFSGAQHQRWQMAAGALLGERAEAFFAEIDGHLKAAEAKGSGYAYLPVPMLGEVIPPGTH